MKRLLDIAASLAGLVLLAPLLVVLAVAIYLQDYHSPFYIADRTGRGGRSFRMVKLRSMVVRADISGVDSTAGDDPRITALGRFIRRFKLDEVPQLWNVLRGDMSLVGPRPNVARETALYTADEKRLLEARPGITDLASIVFSDEGEILRGSDDPDLRYNQVIRPWKSRLGLLYVDARPSISRDLSVVRLTALSAVDRAAALEGVRRISVALGADDMLLRVIDRSAPLPVAPPPGADRVVERRAVVA
ncbi:MAG: sugar transferase [Gemmatimonadaceae bacterium]|nr:sugar transferase [Gemmatimonadaceae bacterium]MDQ3244603.1 sugar transferase [Gemmatimonadota bacterium]